MSKVKPAKLPRATLEQKIKILDFYHQSDKPQLETVEAFKDEVAISTLTFNEWVKREDEYRQQYLGLEGSFQKNSRRKSKFKYEKINRAMDLLVKQRLERGEPVTEPVLRDYWQVYAHQFGVENPKRLCSFSHGWLSQFKKRHGISKPKRGNPEHGREDGVVDATTNSNKQLLTGPVPDSRQVSVVKQTVVPKKYPSEPVGLFRPQKSLNFSLSYPRMVDDPNGHATSPENTTAPAYLDSVKHGSSVLDSGDFERFLETVADPFFLKNQYDYPQTVKLYQEFKSSFVSERLISLRSTPVDYLKTQVPQAHLSSAHSNHRHPKVSLNNSSLVPRPMGRIAAGELDNREFVDPGHPSLVQAYDTSIPLELAEATNRNMDLDRQAAGAKFPLPNNEESDIGPGLVAAQRRHNVARSRAAIQQDYEERALRIQQEQLLEQRDLESQRLLRRQVYETQRQQGHRGHREQMHRPPVHEASSRLAIQKLPRLSVTDNAMSPVLSRAVSSPGLPATLSTAAPFSNSREERGGLDEMFVRPASSKAVSYGDERQWSNKSELRKLWEQNKILLS